jgi:hypothetical protein
VIKGLVKIFKIGGWAPLALLTIHIFISRVLHLYILWPPTDIPMHFLGGVTTAFLISRCFQFLPRTVYQKDWLALLEIVLIISLTATTAVFWEFQEFIRDQLLGSNIQISLANTMQDLAMGILGASVFAFFRSKRLHIEVRQVKQIATDWVRGTA